MNVLNGPIHGPQSSATAAGPGHHIVGQPTSQHHFSTNEYTSATAGQNSSYINRPSSHQTQATNVLHALLPNAIDLRSGGLYDRSLSDSGSSQSSMYNGGISKLAARYGTETAMMTAGHQGGPMLNNESEFPSLGARYSVGTGAQQQNGPTSTGSQMPPMVQVQSPQPTPTQLHHHLHGSITPVQQLASSNTHNSPLINNPTIPTRQAYGSLQYNIGTYHLHHPSKEFRIQNEDFPALPGSDGNSSSTTTANNQLHQQQQQQQHVQPPPSQSIGPSLPDQTKGIQTHSDGSVMNIPPQMLNDQFGMVGLLSSLRAIYSDPRVVSLTLGQDMTTLGLDLNNPEFRKSLHENFGGPWSECPLRVQDMDVSVPPEYLISGFVKEKMAGVKLNRCSIDTLFFLFYQCTGDLYQIAAAYELYSRDWRYHREQRIWLTRSSKNPVQQGEDFERGTYVIFDPVDWKQVHKDMKLEYRMLDDKPKFPNSAPPAS